MSTKEHGTEGVAIPMTPENSIRHDFEAQQHQGADVKMQYRQILLEFVTK